jgi:hypothetical protein
MPSALPKIGFDDLATLFPKIAEEADGWDPSTVKPGSSSQKRYWRCPIGHSYQATPKSRTSGRTGCPYCKGRKVLVGFNDLKSQFREVASQAHGWDPTSVTAHSGQKRDWIKDIYIQRSLMIGVMELVARIATGRKYLPGSMIY